MVNEEIVVCVLNYDVPPVHLFTVDTPDDVDIEEFESYVRVTKRSTGEFCLLRDFYRISVVAEPAKE